MTRTDYKSLALVVLGLYSFYVGVTSAHNTETLFASMLFALIGVGGGAYIQSQLPSSK